MSQTHTHTHTRAAKITCTRRLQFCAGHRVMGHESKCAHLHGHNYVLLATARMDTQCGGKDVDSIGRVIDFSALKNRLGGWIDENWDHGFILHREDAAGQTALTAMTMMMRKIPESSKFTQKHYLMADNPTAENMAKLLLLEICPMLFADTGIIIEHIQLWETENCPADAHLVEDEEQGQ